LQFGGAERDQPLARCRPAVGAALQPLGAHPDPARVEKEDLEQIAATVGENIQIAIERRPPELMRDQRVQAVEPAT
jgi:hypothetical protein